MRVVMFGYQTWGHRTLQALLDSEHEVVLVVTHPTSDHAYERIWSDSVADLAAGHGVAGPDPRPARRRRTARPAQAGRPGRHRRHELAHLDPAARSSTSPGTARSTCTTRCCRRTRGFSPLIWALINGEKEVGVTAHMMDAGLDAGDIVLQRAVPVGDRDTTTDLFHKTLALFGPITVDGLALIAVRPHRLDPAGPLQGELLPQAGRGGQPHRLDLAGGGPRPAGAGAVRPVPERVHASTAAGASASSPRRCPRAVYGGTPGPDLHPRGRRRGHRRRRRGPPRPQPRPRGRADPHRRRHGAGRADYFTTMGGYLTARR